MKLLDALRLRARLLRAAAYPAGGGLRNGHRAPGEGAPQTAPSAAEVELRALRRRAARLRK